MTEVVVLSAVRTPMTRKKTVLKDIHPVDLLAASYRAAIERAGVPMEAVEDAFVGCVSQMGDQSLNVARQAWLAANLPIETPSVSLNMMCGSSQRALQIADAMIRSGQCNVVIAGGIESMSRNPLDVEHRLPEGSVGPYSPGYLMHYEEVHQGEAAERIADRWQIGRSEIDAYAARSHERAGMIHNQGGFNLEIVPIETSEGVVTQDNTIRPDTSAEVIGRLQPSFREGGRLSPGSASQIVDGAACVVLASREAAEAYAAPVLATILGHVMVGSDPEYMLTGPIPATRKLLSKLDMDARDVNWYEVNEAFASIPLAWQRELGVFDDVLNPHGGAIALGHPLGASGARLFTTMLHGLRARGGGYGLQTMCVGGGIGTATLVQV